MPPWRIQVRVAARRGGLNPCSDPWRRGVRQHRLGSLLAVFKVICSSAGGTLRRHGVERKAAPRNGDCSAVLQLGQPAGRVPKRAFWQS